MNIAVHPNLVASRNFKMLDLQFHVPTRPLFVSLHVITRINFLGNRIIAGHAQQLVM